MLKTTLLIIAVYAVVVLLLPKKYLPKAKPKRPFRDDEKPYGLPWMGGTLHPKKKDYFKD